MLPLRDLDKLMRFYHDFCPLQRRNTASKPEKCIKQRHSGSTIALKTPFAVMVVSPLRCSYLRYTQILVFIDAKMSNYVNEASLYTNFGVHQCQNVSIRK